MDIQNQVGFWGGQSPFYDPGYWLKTKITLICNFDMLHIIYCAMLHNGKYSVMPHFSVK
jgi:hypothetical protein